MKILDWTTKNLGITKDVTPIAPNLILILSFAWLVVAGFIVMLLTQGDIVITILAVTVMELIVRVLLFMKHSKK